MIRLLGKKLFILSFCLFVVANVSGIAPVMAGDFVMGVVPQQKASKLTRIWTPLANLISKELGISVKYFGSPDINTFEERLIAGEFDIVYVNPMQYITIKNVSDYQVLAREKDKKLQSILVVAKSNPANSLEELNNKHFVFPEHAFAASMLIQTYLKKRQIPHMVNFVSTHDTAYSLVALGKMDVAGGVLRTYETLNDKVKEKLKILKSFDGLTPHAFVVKPSMSNELQQKIQKLLINLPKYKVGQKFLIDTGFNPLVIAKDSEWDDIRELMNSGL